MSATEIRAVFLSYASQDAEAARRICDALRGAGVEVWFDQSELRGGDAWDQRIRKQIRDCALFVPVISANTQARREGYFRLEWKLADDRTHLMASGTPFLLPVCVDDTKDWDALVPDSFTIVQWTRLPGGDASAVFCARVKSLLGAESEVETGRPRPVQRGEGTASPFRRNSPRTWAVTGLAAVAIIAAVAFWPWTERSPSSSTDVGAPLSEARQLTLKARALIDDDLMAVRENFRLADELCQKAVALDVTDGEAWATAARISAELVRRNYDASSQRRAAARSQAERAIRLAPQSVEAGLAEAANLALTMNTAEAERRLRELLAGAPGDPRVALALASALDALGRAAEASEIRLRHPAFDRRDPRPLVDEAIALRRRGQAAEAEALVNRAQDMAPSFKGYLTKLSLLLFEWGDLEAGERAIMNLPPGLMQEDVFASVAAQLWLWLGRGDQAMMELQRVPQEFLEGGSELNFQPKGYLTGWAMQIAGRPGAAQAEWTQALLVVERRLAAEPNRPALLRWKALLQARTGQTDAAEKTWKLYSELSGRVNNPHGYIAMEFFVAMGRLEDAIALLQGRNARSDARMYAIGLRYEPWFAPLRSDPSMQEMINEAVGWVAEARQKGAKTLAAKSADALTPAQSVAVLAFDNLSDDRSNEYFSDGISEELINVLGRVPGLTVKGRTSSFFFKGRQVPMAEMAQQLGVAYIVRGGVRKAGNRVRITVQLTRAANDEVVWSSEAIERDLQDVWAVQEEIAGLIAKSLSLKLGATSHVAKIGNPEAFRLYLEARHFWGLRSFDGFDRAEVELQKAVSLEPESGLLHAALADVHAMRGWYRRNEGRAVGDDFVRARVEADRALELDPENPVAYAAPTMLAFHERNWPEAERLVRKALAVGANDAAAYDRLGDLMLWTGRLDEGLAAYRRALQMDPLSIFITRDVTQSLLHAQRYEELIEATIRAEVIAPRDPRLLLHRMFALSRTGRTAEAVALLKAIHPSLIDEQVLGPVAIEAVFYLRTFDLYAESEALAAHLAERFAPGSYLRGYLALCRGRIEEALPTLKDCPVGLTHRLFWGPAFDPWREDPRFQRAIADAPFAAEYKTARATLARMIDQPAVKK